MNVQRIRLEGRGADPARNVNRVVIEVDVASVNGKGIEGRRAPHGVSRIEVYADRLPSIAEQTRTAAHEETYRQAARICATYTEQWEADNRRAKIGKTDEEWRVYRDLHCSHRPEQFLGMLGLPGGLPSIKSCSVVSRDGVTKVDVRDFLQMEDDAREPFLIDPPATPESLQDQTAKYLQAIAQSFGGGRSKRNG